MKQKLRLGIALLRNLSIILRKDYKAPAGNKEVFMDLKEGRMIPSYFYILYAFHEQGYKVRMKFRLKFIAGFFGPNIKALKLPHLFFYLKNPKDSDFLLITDVQTQVSGERSVLLNPLAFERIRMGDRNRHFLPYLMHPDVYLSRDFTKVSVLRQSERKIRIFYSGNTDQTAYDNPNIPTSFGMENRYQIISFLQNNLSEEKLVAISNKNEWISIFKDGFCNKLVMIRWEWSPLYSKNLDTRIKKENWLPTLASSQFFLACPGISVPYSHNAIEAMSVGTIPILSYNDYFLPALEHGKNCIYFKNKQDLIRQVEDILRMPYEKVKEMSDNVVKYYNEHLSLKTVTEKVEQASVSTGEVFYFNEVLY